MLFWALLWPLRWVVNVLLLGQSVPGNFTFVSEFFPFVNDGSHLCSDKHTFFLNTCATVSWIRFLREEGNDEVLYSFWGVEIFFFLFLFNCTTRQDCAIGEMQTTTHRHTTLAPSKHPYIPHANTKLAKNPEWCLSWVARHCSPGTRSGTRPWTTTGKTGYWWPIRVSTFSASIHLYMFLQ